jgi:hypothetical protein
MWWIYLIFFALLAGEAAAQSVVKLRVQRLQALGDGKLGQADGRIDEPELRAFLKEKLEAILAENPGAAPPPDIDDYLDAQVTRKVMNVLANGNGFLEEIELDRLKEIVFDTPLPPMAALLPSHLLDPMADEPPAVQTGPSLLDVLETRLQIRQSFLDQRFFGKPATLTWTGFGSSDRTLEEGRERQKYELKTALIVDVEQLRATRSKQPPDPWEIGRYYGTWGGPVFVVEADISSESKDKRNLITHRVGLQPVLFTKELTQGLSGHNFSLTFDYMTDKDYHAEALGGTFQWTPDILGIGLGAYLPHDVERSFYFRWRPYLGLVYSDLRDTGGNPQFEKLKDITNGFGRVTFDFLLGSHFKITPEWSYYHEFKNEDRGHKLFSVAGQLLLDKKGRLTLLVSHERGESAPLFVKKEVTQVGLGLKL